MYWPLSSTPVTVVRRFHDAGLSVLAFGYQEIDKSGGQPGQVQRIRGQSPNPAPEPTVRVRTATVHAGPQLAHHCGHAEILREQVPAD
jgi:Protein of unknown function (DUF664)